MTRWTLIAAIAGSLGGGACSNASPKADVVDVTKTDSAPTPDTIATPDTTPTSDTTAIPDTAATPDSSPSQDTVLPTDAVAEDTVVTPSRGPAYEAGTAGCSADDGTRRIKMVNNCEEARWFKLDGKTTPLWARPTGCPWHGTACTDLYDVTQCTAAAKAAVGDAAAPGLVWCLPTGVEAQGACYCNPYFKLAPGEAHEIALADDAAIASATGWLGKDCNVYGSACEIGSDSAKTSLFEFTYDAPGSVGADGQWTGGLLWYDLSAVNSWTSVSPVGMRSCGGANIANQGNVFWCGGTGCRFDVATQCPDGSASFAAAPAGCDTCPTQVVDGKTVIDGSCGSCPDGSSGNPIPTGTTFNPNHIGGPEWTWSGPPDFAQGWGDNQGASTDRRYSCTGPGPVCVPAGAGGEANTCLGGCDLCAVTQGAASTDEACIKYCCPDVVKTYGGFDFRYDSAGCHALGVQAGTDYTVAIKSACPYVYTYGYEDHTSTFTCDTQASLVIQSCPDPTDFPASLVDQPSP